MEPNPTLYGQQNNSQKVRFIIITAIVAVVILGIAVWAIVAMVSGKNKSTTANTSAETSSVAQTDQTDKTDKDSEKKSSDITATTEGVVKTVPATTENKTDSSAEKDIPTTGPEEILPAALVLGSLTTFLGSLKLVKEM